MQTLYKYSLILLLALSWGCSDFLEVDVDDDVQANPENSLTIAVRDPGSSSLTGFYQLLVEGPKDFSGSFDSSTVKLQGLPAGQYLISVVKDGYVTYRKQVLIFAAAEEGVEQRYRLEVPLARRGKVFRFSGESGGVALFPEGSATTADAPFSASAGVNRYSQVRVELAPCALDGISCSGEIAFSASILPQYSEVLAGKIGPAGQMGLFLLDFESVQPLKLSRPAMVTFPVRLEESALRKVRYSMIRMENDPSTGLQRYSGESVPVVISADGQVGTAAISNLSADWMFVAEVKVEAGESATGFSTLARSLRPGKALSTELLMRTSIPADFAALLGLTAPEVELFEPFRIEPPRNKTAEVKANYQVRRIRLTNPLTGEVITLLEDLPNYPVMFKALVAIPHDSGGG